MSNARSDAVRRLSPPLLAVTAAVLVSAAPALASDGCPNEQVRHESDTNPTTGQPYSANLPECRAYEMVSPLEKQAHDAKLGGQLGLPISPNGDAVGFASEGAFAGEENYRVNFSPDNMYLSVRGPSGWKTVSSFAPASLINSPFLDGLDGDFSPDLTSRQVSCGENNNGPGEDSGHPFIACAVRENNGAWGPATIYKLLDGTSQEATEAYRGASSGLSRVFLQPNEALMPADTLTRESAGIYEIANIGTSSAELRLVNVDNSGNELLNGREGPLLGNNHPAPAATGTSYHAISESGKAVFFTATPASTGTPAVFARIGSGEAGARTVNISDPGADGVAECTTCVTTAHGATFQGASADGSKVFFTTSQQLLNSDTDTTPDLYEYDFANAPGRNLVQVSGGGLGDPSPGTGAEVQGVLRNSPDGCHVYFVADGVLTTAPNSLGEVAQPNHRNLYGYDTNTGETQFVTANGPTAEAEDVNRRVQTTPDGRFLVYSNDRAAYRYDFQTGELTLLSHAAPGFTAPGAGKGAEVAAIPGYNAGADADISDWSRAISDDGEYVLFTTNEKLAADDVNEATDAYLWHNGVVSLISDGQDPEGAGFFRSAGGLGEAAPAPSVGMSSSGSDIFFFSHTPLVGQDTDVLRDLYDARSGGGFPGPAGAQACSGEACQSTASPAPAFGTPASITAAAGGNLVAQAFQETVQKPPGNPAQTKLTYARRLRKALRRCRKHKSKAQRKRCDRLARRPPGRK